MYIIKILVNSYSTSVITGKWGFISHTYWILEDTSVMSSKYFISFNLLLCKVIHYMLVMNLTGLKGEKILDTIQYLNVNE